MASVKVAVSLLVLIAAASIAGALIPQGENLGPPSGTPGSLRTLSQYLQLNDVFHSRWYLLLLGLLGSSLFAVTVKRVPTVWKNRGRGPALGILLAHMGVLVLLVAMIQGGVAGVRYYAHLVEGDVTVVPMLPFVIKLDRLDVAYYARSTFPSAVAGFRRTLKQDSTLTLFHHGTSFLSGAASPGQPLVARGMTLLPAHRDVGWSFDLVLEAGGREKVVPIRPWDPPLITLNPGSNWRIFAHRLVAEGHDEASSLADASQDFTAEVFLLRDDGSSRSLGHARQDRPLRFGEWSISVGNVRRYTGLHIYSRPEQPLLVAGTATLIVGLIGYFSGWGSVLLPGRRTFGRSRLVRRPA